MRASEKLKEIIPALEASGIKEAGAEAEAVLRDALGLDKAALLRDDPELSPDELKKLDEIVSERALRKPLEYITGRVEFLGLSLAVGPGVLVPRPETELMAELAIKLLKEKNMTCPRVLDMCTGCGCIALSIKKNLPDSFVTATDISPLALNYARKNALSNGVENIRLLKGRLFEALGVDERPFDLIVSNPPYVKTSDISALMPEVSKWEPPEALDGGPDGMEALRGIIGAAPKFLKKNGLLLLEMGISQAGPLTDFAAGAGRMKTKTLRDYAGVERFFVGEFA